MTGTRRRNNSLCLAIIAAAATIPWTFADAEQPRPRARDAGVVVGVFPTGEHNAITDVAGVKVGHATVVSGDDVRTGVTAIVPAPGNLYTHPVRFPHGFMSAMATEKSSAPRRCRNSASWKRRFS